MSLPLCIYLVFFCVEGRNRGEFGSVIVVFEKYEAGQNHLRLADRDKAIG